MTCIRARSWLLKKKFAAAEGRYLLPWKKILRETYSSPPKIIGAKNMTGWAWITIGAVVLAVVIMQIAARFADYDE